jgi:hypothetical protein
VFEEEELLDFVGAFDLRSKMICVPTGRVPYMSIRISGTPDYLYLHIRPGEWVAVKRRESKHQDWPERDVRGKMVDQRDRRDMT